MDIDAAIRLLEGAGYSVVKLPDRATFPCKHGHNHKTAEARADCLERVSKSTGLTVHELAARAHAESRPRYVSAYRRWLEARNYRIVGEEFGVTRTRAREMVRKGYRYCCADGDQGDAP